MASMASPTGTYGYNHMTRHRKLHVGSSTTRQRIFLCQQPKNDDKDNKSSSPIARREMILKSSEIATIGAIFNITGKKPDYLGVQKNQQALALCPMTKNCVSTSENKTDPIHYAPPWNYNGGRKEKPVSREVAMEELLEVINSTRPDKFTPKIAEKKDDYVRVEYQTPVLGFVDDVEFWFRPGKDSIVEYRSASRLGNFDFDANRKRIKALRLELEKKRWTSEETI